MRRKVRDAVSGEMIVMMDDDVDRGRDGRRVMWKERER